MNNRDKSAEPATKAAPDKSPKPMDDASNSPESNKADNKTARQNGRGN